MKTLRKLLLCLTLLVVSVAFFALPTVFADLKSAHYDFNETSLGGIGSTNTSSANYQAYSSGGIIGFGNSASASFQINAGHTTTSDPALEFAVDTPSVSFGQFSPAAATVSTSSFQVADYTSYGYVVQILGNPPSSNGHTIAAMSTTGVSMAGVEQFGINLVANTSPVSVGANPDHGQFGFGSAATNYNTANNYRFVSGETIASAPKSSGMTIYTISYLVNVNNITIGGQYSGTQTIVCTGTY